MIISKDLIFLYKKTVWCNGYFHRWQNAQILLNLRYNKIWQNHLTNEWKFVKLNSPGINVFNPISLENATKSKFWISLKQIFQNLEYIRIIWKQITKVKNYKFYSYDQILYLIFNFPGTVCMPHPKDHDHTGCCAIFSKRIEAQIFRTRYLRLPK